MKKSILLFLGVLSLITLVGCKKEDDKKVMFQDDGVTVVGDAEEEEVEEIPTTSVLEESLNIIDNTDFEVLDKAAYDEYMASLPKTEAGVLDFNQFSPTQQALFDKFQNGQLVTEFSAEDVLKDVLNFFSNDNLNRISNIKYTENLNKIRGSYEENKDTYKTYLYNATVVDNGTIKKITSTCTYRIGKSRVNFNYDYILNYPESYYYGFKTQPKGVYYHVGKTDNFLPAITEVSKIVNKGLTNFSVENVENGIYTCIFDVDTEVYNQSNLTDRSYIEEIFSVDKGKQINGQVIVNYNTKRIDEITFYEQLNDTDKNLISFSFEDYNQEKYEKELQDYMSFEDAEVMRDYIEAKKNESARPYDNREEEPEPTEETVTEGTEEVEETEETEETEPEEKVDLWATFEFPPDGTIALLDENGKRILDVEGHAIFVYKDTFIPYKPEQIPAGSDTPIGTAPQLEFMQRYLTTQLENN